MGRATLPAGFLLMGLVSVSGRGGEEERSRLETTQLPGHGLGLGPATEHLCFILRIKSERTQHKREKLIMNYMYVFFFNPLFSKALSFCVGV